MTKGNFLFYRSHDGVREYIHSGGTLRHKELLPPSEFVNEIWHKVI